ncbi:MAG TPA: hypothetical protein VFA61_10205 [Candidatus Udaeobacter sp.]|nr:hypothetical protein [Candidatus Udaeobacter sp.]
MPVAWLFPLSKGTLPVVLVCAAAAALPLLFRRGAGSAFSLLVIALTQAVFQAWCYNTGTHPAVSPFQIWGILPGSDSNLYYTAASDLLNGQKITAMAGARHPFPLLLAVLLKILRHDFKSITFVLTIVMALATWSAFEVIRVRLGGLAATVYLVCITFYIRLHCTGLFMTEQLGLLYSLCGVGILVESLARDGKVRTWLYCGGLFFITQALNARPAAYMTLPFLVLAAWELCQGNFRARAKMVGLSAAAVATSLFLHEMTYYRVMAWPCPSNAWFCVYGLLNGGTWADGRKHAEELLQHKLSQAPSDRKRIVEQAYPEALQLLREECLAEISHHPGKLLAGWWRALRFFWSKNTPFRSLRPEMPSAWFTESAHWCAVLGLLLSLFFLMRGRQLASKLKTYQTLSWLNLAAVLGTITSLPAAPPWDGETRIFAATLPLFFLLPSSGVGGLYLLIATKFYEVTAAREADFQPKIPVGLALALGGALSIVVVLASWCLVGNGSSVKNRRHPVKLMVDELVLGDPAVSSVDLRSLKAGYHLHVTDNTQHTWLPNISQSDFIQNIPRGRYLPFLNGLKQVPPGTEVVALPYWVLLVLDREDAQAQRFTPMPEQTGHPLLMPVYFSKRLRFQDH